MANEIARGDLLVQGRLDVDEALKVDGDLQHSGSKVGFNGTAAITKPTVTGIRASNTALASLLTALANLGLITDSTTAT